MSIRPGRLVSVAIVVTWAGLVGTQLLKSYGGPDAAPLVDLSTPSSRGAELTQRGVFYRGARIGYIRERFTPLEKGFRAEQTGELTLNLLGRERQVLMEGSAETGANNELRSFSFRLATSSGRSPFETLVNGKVEGSDLRLTIRSSGSERTDTRSITEPIVLPVNLYYTLASRDLTPGKTYRLRLFDPMTLSDGEATVKVGELEIVRWGGREEEAHRLETTFAGLTTKAWVNDRGEVLQEETPLGWTLMKEAPGSSLQASRSDGPVPDMIAMSAVPAIGFAGDSGHLQSATLSLLRFPEGFSALEGGRQKREGRNLVIQRETPPYTGDDRLDPDEESKSLAADSFIQSDDPRIVATARSIAGEGSPTERARAINRWVYDNLTKSPTLSLPSAREILERRVGDCNEHAVLFTALARSVGIPTRIATGLTYTGGQFYYHAWPEVFVGRWLAVDPTLGQFPADPLHLRLLTGGMESQYEVLKLMGRGAMIEVLETR
jgi:Transglutaminase-like superfamily